MFNLITYLGMSKFSVGAPANVGLPVISGSPVVGQTLTTTTGTWTGSPTSYSYQWKSGGSNVGSNANSYSLQVSDVGKTITVEVTATNVAGASAPATSAATTAVTAASTGSFALTSITFGTPFRYNSNYPSKYMQGDTFANTWADNDTVYMIADDTTGFNGAYNSNVAMFSLSSPVDNSTTGTNINALPSFGGVSSLGSDGASWKGSSIISVGGTLYMWVGRNFYGKWFTGSGENRQTTRGGQLIKSTDKGLNWTPLPPTNQPYGSPMFPADTFSNPVFLQYGKDYADPGVDSAGTYVYAYGNNGFWNNGDSLVVGRCLKTAIGNLSASDWKFYQGGDGTSNANWGALASAAPIISKTKKVSWPSIQYIPSVKRYVMIQWHYPYVATDVTGTLNQKLCTWELYEAAAPWGPWTKFAERSFEDGLYNPAVVPKNVSNLTGTVLAAGDFFDGGVTGKYTLTLLNYTLGSGADSTPVPYVEPTCILDSSNKTAGISLTLAGRGVNTGATDYDYVRGTVGRSTGKYYFEVLWFTGNRMMAGVTKGLPTKASGTDADTYMLFTDGTKSFAGSATAGSYGFSTAGWLGIACDLTNNRVYFTNDGVTWLNSANPVAGTGGQTLAAGTYYPLLGSATSASPGQIVLFANGFTFPVPSGYSPWG